MPTRDGLSVKQRAFVEYLFGEANLNATKAAELAHYRCPREAGYNLVDSPKVSRAIAIRLDNISMQRAEVIARLSDIASGAMQFFMHDGRIDLDSKIAKQKVHLIKSIAQDVSTQYDKDGSVKSETVKTKIEVYDALAALTILAKYHGLLQVEALSQTTNNTLVISDWRTQAASLGLSEQEIIDEAKLILQEQAPAQPAQLATSTTSTLRDDSPHE